MKKILLFIAITLISLNINAQLNDHAKTMRSANVVIFDNISEYSKAKWGDDYTMIVYEINNQCNSFIEWICLAINDDKEQTITYNALTKWSLEGFEKYNSSYDLTEAHANWTMVLYESKKQLEAYRSIN